MTSDRTATEEDYAVMEATNPFIRLDPLDNVVIARREVPAGTAVPAEALLAIKNRAIVFAFNEQGQNQAQGQGRNEE